MQKCSFRLVRIADWEKTYMFPSDEEASHLDRLLQRMEDYNFSDEDKIRLLEKNSTSSYDENADED